MHVQAIQPDIDHANVLIGAQFIDAYRIVLDDAALDAREAAERMFARKPHWVSLLMTLRDRIGTFVGLKTARDARQSATDLVGFFPVISETPDKLVAGLNDRHLDFRVVVDVAGTTQRRVTATTIVLTHNMLGRVYLTIIMPFHRLIVRAMLRQVADQSLTSAR